MESHHNDKQLGDPELIKKAEEMFPYPFKACPFQIKKTNWKRDQWIIKQKEA